MKKRITTRRVRGPSSSSFDNKRFVFVDAKRRFHNSIKRRLGLKEWGFELEPPYMAEYKAVIISKGWQVFCKQPKAMTMTIVRKFYANLLSHKV